MHDYILYNRMFEKATWILTNKQSKESKQCDYFQMCRMVISAYVTHHNKHYSQYPYSQKKIDASFVSIRYLHLGGCEIFRNKESMVENVGYEKILPEYDIDCYGWYYQCSEGRHVLDTIREQGEERLVKAWCRYCLDYVTV